MARERDLDASLVSSGPVDAVGGTVTMPMRVALRWKKKKFAGVIGRGRDDTTAQLVARLEHAGGAWRVAALHLGAPFAR